MDDEYKSVIVKGRGRDIFEVRGRNDVDLFTSRQMGQIGKSYALAVFYCAPFTSSNLDTRLFQRSACWSKIQKRQGDLGCVGYHVKAVVSNAICFSSRSDFDIPTLEFFLFYIFTFRNKI